MLELKEYVGHQAKEVKEVKSVKKTNSTKVKTKEEPTKKTK